MNIKAGRKALALGLLAPLLALSACGGDNTAGSETQTITIGTYGSGTTALATNVPAEFLEKNEQIQADHKIKVVSEEYSDLQTLYTDVTIGRIDVAIGGPSIIASNASTGAPLAVGGTVARSTNSVMSAGKPWTKEEIKGSRIVAQTSSGSWKAVQTRISSNFGLEPGRDYELINSESTAAAAIQAATGKADYAIVRAEQILIAQQQFPNLKVVADPEDLGLVTGRADWGYVLIVNTNKIDQESSDRLTRAIGDTTEWMKQHPDDVEQFAVGKGQTPGVTKAFLTSGDVKYDVQTLDEARDDMKLEFEALLKSGVIKEAPPSSVYGEK